MNRTTGWMPVMFAILVLAGCNKKEAAVEVPPPTPPEATAEPTPATKPKTASAPATPTPEVAPQIAAATPTPRPTTPPGIYFTTQYFSVETDGGISGIKPGTKVKQLKDLGGILRVSDGNMEFDARKEHLTNDVEKAAEMTRQDAVTQQQVRPPVPGASSVSAGKPASAKSEAMVPTKDKPANIYEQQFKDATVQIEQLRSQYGRLDDQASSIDVNYSKLKTSPNELAKLRQKEKVQAQMEEILKSIHQMEDAKRVLRAKMRQ